VQEDVVNVGLVYDVRLSLPEGNVRDVRSELALNTGEELVPDSRARIACFPLLYHNAIVY